MPSDRISVYQTQKQKQEPILRMPEPAQKAQPYPMSSQYQYPAAVYNESLKNNQMIQPSAYDMQSMNQALSNNAFLTPSSLTSANPMYELSLASQQKQKQQKSNANSYFDQSNSNKNNLRYQFPGHTTATDESFALNKQNNNHSKQQDNDQRHAPKNNAFRDTETDQDTDTKRDLIEWLSQPLCFGLTRCSGGILFGVTSFLACGSLAGLIASIVLYSQDNNTNSQWKILGIVICSIMLITIIFTILLFILCYKYGFMISPDDEDDSTDIFKKSDGKQYERQRDTVGHYKFNQTNDSLSIPSGIVQDVSTPKLLHRLTIPVSDKQTNTETSIASLRSKDFNRGVWPSKHMYGGVSYVPQVPPKKNSLHTQAVPNDIDEALKTVQLHMYPVANPVSIVPPSKNRPKMINTSDDEEESVIEVSEIVQKKRQQPVMDQQAQKQKIILVPKSQIEHVFSDEQQPPSHFDFEYSSGEEPQYVELIATKGKRPHHIEYVDTEEEEDLPQPRHTDGKHKLTHKIENVPVKAEQKQPQFKQHQHEIVEDVNERAGSPQIEETDEPSKHDKKHKRKKHKKQGFGKVSIKHVKPTN